MTREDVIRKVVALLRMADGGTNENESAVALETAQRLADAHNLDIGTIGQSGSREDETVAKGFYKYQRDLFRSIAHINHCMCWVSARMGRGARSTIRLVGSQVNVAMTKNLCGYVENVANRLVRANYASDQFLSRNAHYFREGLIERLLERIERKRDEEEATRRRRQREQERTDPNSTAIVLIRDVARAEEKANYDYLHGEGAWDRREAQREKWRQEQRDTNAAYEQWKKDHPEEYARQVEQDRKEMEQERKRLRRNAKARHRARERRQGDFFYEERAPKETKWGSEHYYKGKDEAEKVSLNEQIDSQSGGKSKALRTRKGE